MARFNNELGDWRSVWREIASLAEEKLIRLERRREWKRTHYGRE
jgi:hypothetical protein